MTEEIIIIDGVDVSGCVKQGETVAGITCGNGERIRLANEIITKHKLCKDNPNCIYKQLKRKEQECDKLYIQLKADEEYHKEEENTLRKIIKNKEERNIELYKENNQLKEDNEELKNAYTRLNSLYNDNCNFTDKLEQSLTEIKEIAEGMHDLWINKTPYTDMDNLVKHLLECELNRIRYKLDEISECEADNDR